MPEALTEYLFERIYEQVDADGDRRRVVLRVGRPFLPEGDSIWRCRCRIDRGGARGRVNTAQGLDALDALLWALKIADALLKSHTEPPLHTIYWQGDIPGTGLPVIEVDPVEASLPSAADSVFEEVLKTFFLDFKPKRLPADQSPE